MGKPLFVYAKSISKLLQRPSSNLIQSSSELSGHNKSAYMSAVEQLGGYDPFADTGLDGIGGSGVNSSLVHIRIQQRNGRKTLTTVQGVDPKYDFKKIVKAAKKDFNCNGTVVEHPEYGEVIQLQGDQRESIKNLLVKVGICTVQQLKVHGF